MLIEKLLFIEVKWCRKRKIADNLLDKTSRGEKKRRLKEILAREKNKTLTKLVEKT